MGAVQFFGCHEHVFFGCFCCFFVQIYLLLDVLPPKCGNDASSPVFLFELQNGLNHQLVIFCLFFGYNLTLNRGAYLNMSDRI